MNHPTQRPPAQGRGRLNRHKPRKDDGYSNEIHGVGCEPQSSTEPKPRRALAAKPVGGSVDPVKQMHRAGELAERDLQKEYERRSSKKRERGLEEERQAERVRNELRGDGRGGRGATKASEESEDKFAERFGSSAYADLVTGHSFWHATNSSLPRRVIVVYPWIAAVCRDIPLGRQWPAMAILAQLNYYFRRPNRPLSRGLRAKVRRHHHLWVAKTRTELAAECFLTESRVRRAVDALVRLAVLVRIHARFNGLRAGHYRIDWDVAQEVAHRNGWREEHELLPNYRGAEEDDDEVEQAVFPFGKD